MTNDLTLLSAILDGATAALLFTCVLALVLYVRRRQVPAWVRAEMSRPIDPAAELERALVALRTVPGVRIIDRRRPE